MGNSDVHATIERQKRAAPPAQTSLRVERLDALAPKPVNVLVKRPDMSALN